MGSNNYTHSSPAVAKSLFCSTCSHGRHGRRHGRHRRDGRHGRPVASASWLLLLMLVLLLLLLLFVSSTTAENAFQMFFMRKKKKAAAAVPAQQQQQQTEKASADAVSSSDSNGDRSLEEAAAATEEERTCIDPAAFEKTRAELTAAVTAATELAATTETLLSKKIHQLQQDKETLQSQLEAVSAANETAAEQLQVLQKDLHAAVTAVSVEQRALADYKEQVKQEREPIRVRNRQVVEREQQKVQDCQTEKSALVKEKNDWQSKYGALDKNFYKKVKDAVHVTEIKSAELSKQVSALQAGLDSVGARNTVLQEQYDALRRDYDDLWKLHQGGGDEDGGSSRKKEAAFKKVKRLERENSILLDETKTLQHNLTSAGEQYEQAQREILSEQKLTAAAREAVTACEANLNEKLAVCRQKNMIIQAEAAENERKCLSAAAEIQAACETNITAGAAACEKRQQETEQDCLEKQTEMERTWKQDVQNTTAACQRTTKELMDDCETNVTKLRDSHTAKMKELTSSHEQAVQQLSEQKDTAVTQQRDELLSDRRKMEHNLTGTIKTLQSAQQSLEELLHEADANQTNLQCQLNDMAADSHYWKTVYYNRTSYCNFTWLYHDATETVAPYQEQLKELYDKHLKKHVDSVLDPVRPHYNKHVSPVFQQVRHFLNNMHSFTVDRLQRFCRQNSLVTTTTTTATKKKKKKATTKEKEMDIVERFLLERCKRPEETVTAACYLLDTVLLVLCYIMFQAYKRRRRRRHRIPSHTSSTSSTSSSSDSATPPLPPPNPPRVEGEDFLTKNATNGGIKQDQEQKKNNNNVKR